MDVFEEHEGTHILQSMDGFAISLASDARFLYISETVSIYLGLSQVSSYQNHMRLSLLKVKILASLCSSFYNTTYTENCNLTLKTSLYGLLQAFFIEGDPHSYTRHIERVDRGERDIVPSAQD
jgi:hypothetical protein